MSTNFFMSDPIAKLLGFWAHDPGEWTCYLFKIVLSLILAALVGWERASKRHAAGLRTFMLVSFASTVAMILDVTMIFHGVSIAPFISAATVIGLAILSINSTLYSSRNQIKGLTTSVALWAEGIIGFSIGAGLYTIALISFVAFFCCLSLFPRLEAALKDRSNHFEVHLELKNISFLQDFVTTIRALGMKIDDIESNPAYLGSGLSVYSVSISVTGKELKQYKTHKEIIEALQTLEYIHHIEEM